MIGLIEGREALLGILESLEISAESTGRMFKEISCII